MQNMLKPDGKHDNETVVFSSFSLPMLEPFWTLLTLVFKSFHVSNQQQAVYHRQSQFVGVRDPSFAV